MAPPPKRPAPDGRGNGASLRTHLGSVFSAVVTRGTRHRRRHCEFHGSPAFPRRARGARHRGGNGALPRTHPGSLFSAVVARDARHPRRHCELHGSPAFPHPFPAQPLFGEAAPAYAHPPDDRRDRWSRQPGTRRDSLPAGLSAAARARCLGGPHGGSIAQHRSTDRRLRAEDWAACRSREPGRRCHALTAGVSSGAPARGLVSAHCVSTARAPLNRAPQTCAGSRCLPVVRSSHAS